MSLVPTWPCIILVLILRYEVSAVLSSAVRGGLLWRSSRVSLRGLAARPHLVIPRRAGPEPTGWWAVCGDIQLLYPIQCEIPKHRIVCGQIQTRCTQLKHITRHATCASLWLWLTAPAKFSLVPLGLLLCLSLDTRTPSWPGEIKKQKDRTDTLHL